MRARLLALLPLLLLGGLLVPQAGAAAPLGGPDVSRWQHDDGRAIDWRAVKRSGQSFAFLKATSGTDKVDPWFTREWPAARAAGVIRGAYHFADPSRSADAQAAFVVSVVGSTREAGNLGIALDLERTGGLSPRQLVAWAHAFLDGVERRTGRVPVVYSYPYFWQTAMANDRSFGAYPLWLARYASSAPPPLPGWTQWTFWQHTDRARLPGIVGLVDHNVMCCSAGTLAALAEGRTTAITRLWKQLGGASGRLGLPLGPEVAVPGGWGQQFQRGFVASTRAHGTHSVTGPVWDRYRASGGARGALGVPVAEARTAARGVVEQVFTGGRVLQSAATGAHALRGALLARWLRDGGVRSAAGLPTAEQVGPGQQLTGGGLYAGPGGVHLVPGALRDRYEELGGYRSPLGLPVSDAQALTPAARVVRFQTGQLAEVVLAGSRVVV